VAGAGSKFSPGAAFIRPGDDRRGMDSGDVAIFERFAPVYDLLMPSADPATLHRGLARADRPVERVLDVGGGTGRGARALDARERLVVDPAEAMGRRAREHGLAVLRGDGAHLPLTDRCVDAVLVVDALHHVRDQRGLLAEARRVLRPGGVLVVREFDPTTLLGRVLAAGERTVGFDSTFHPPAGLRDAVADTGLDAAVVETGFGYTVAGVRPGRS